MFCIRGFCCAISDVVYLLLLLFLYHTTSHCKLAQTNILAEVRIWVVCNSVTNIFWGVSNDDESQVELQKISAFFLLAMSLPSGGGGYCMLCTSLYRMVPKLCSSASVPARMIHVVHLHELFACLALISSVLVCVCVFVFP